jgi:hypothetical protein
MIMNCQTVNGERQELDTNKGLINTSKSISGNKSRNDGIEYDCQ